MTCFTVGTKPLLIVQSVATYPACNSSDPAKHLGKSKPAVLLLCRRNQFKAHPVNAKILTNPNTGVRKVPSKPPTQPEGFALSSGIPKKKENKDEEEHFEFHANPLNKKILEGPVVCKSWCSHKNYGSSGPVESRVPLVHWQLWQSWTIRPVGILTQLCPCVCSLAWLVKKCDVLTGQIYTCFTWFKKVCWNQISFSWSRSVLHWQGEGGGC